MDANNNLEEEVFCLKYELQTLANVLLRNESERWVPEYLHERTEHSHIERYKLACNYSGGKKVIDVACGAGKGTFIVATQGNAQSIKGFDIQPDAVRYANWRYKNPNVEFATGNAEALGIHEEFDLAISFETVEHLPDYKSFLLSISKCLKPGGQFIISTPISALPVDHKPANPYHVQEWGFEQFQDVLKHQFIIEKVFVQLYPKKPELLPPLSQNIIKRILRKVKNKLSPPAVLAPEPKPVNDFSKIEEFTGQYPVNELGTSRIGYQVVLAKKKS